MGAVLALVNERGYPEVRTDEWNSKVGVDKAVRLLTLEMDKKYKGFEHKVTAEVNRHPMDIKYACRVGIDILRLLGADIRDGVHYFHAHIEDIIGKTLKSKDMDIAVLCRLGIYAQRNYQPPPEYLTLS